MMKKRNLRASLNLLEIKSPLGFAPPYFKPKPAAQGSMTSSAR